MSIVDIELLPGNMLVENESKFQGGMAGNIHLPQRFSSAPIEICRVLQINPDERTLQMLGMPPEDLIDKRVYFRGVGGRPVDPEGTRSIYPTCLCINPQKKGKARKYEISILGILEGDVEVVELETDDMRCKFCGDARLGDRAGRSMMLQKRLIEGRQHWWCPRCYKDSEGVKRSPPKSER